MRTQYTFPIITKKQVKNLEHVFPLQQEAVVKICDALKRDNAVDTVMLFGSSVTNDCTIRSDLDIAIRLRPNYTTNDNKLRIIESIQKNCNWVADIFWHDELDANGRLYKEILKGEQIL